MSDFASPLIRPVTPADAYEWLRMRQLLWPSDQPQVHLREMEDLKTQSEASVFVAQRPHSGLCGFLEAGTRPYADGCDTRPVGYIEGWFVDADSRRRGVGRALVAAAEAWARSIGLHEMASDTYLTNQDGLVAHLSLGYKETERLIHFAKTL